MNIIGHNFVAKTVLEKYNPEIAAGCHLPDLVPFLKGSTLSFEEIHENPELVFEYSTKHNGVGKDLALGLMTHSVKFGADKFNKDIDTWLLKDDDAIKQQIAGQIMEASNISIETAKEARMHNYLWCGIDFFIIDNYPDVISGMNTAYENIDINGISRILSTVFNKPFDLIRNDIKKHIDLVNNHNIKDKQSFLMFWKDFISDLPDKDDVDLNKALKTVTFIENYFNKNWPQIINKVVSNIKNNMRPYLER